MAGDMAQQNTMSVLPKQPHISSLVGCEHSGLEIPAPGSHPFSSWDVGSQTVLPVL